MENVAPDTQAGSTSVGKGVDLPGVKDATMALLKAFGLDAGSPGLVGTPNRVARSWGELLSGYAQDPAKILERTFPLREPPDELVLLRNIEFHSTCEHHLLPFSGVAHVAYLPAGGRVVGISKLARVVDCFALRLQIQEQMTMQVANTIDEHLRPAGIAVIIEATHLCMVCRGVGKRNPTMTTSAMLGAFRSNPSLRAELLSILKN